MGANQLHAPYLNQPYTMSRIPPGIALPPMVPPRHRYEYLHPDEPFPRFAIPSPRGSYHPPSYAYSPYDIYSREEPLSTYEAIPSPRFKMPQASYLGNARRNPSPDLNTNWRMKGGHQKKKGKKPRNEKRDNYADHDVEQSSIQYIHREIDNNRGNLIYLATQQQGCRHLQLAIEHDGMPVVELLYEELGDHMASLMSDPFGNYLFQELVEMSSEEQLLSLVRMHGLFHRRSRMSRAPCAPRQRIPMVPVVCRS